MDAYLEVELPEKKTIPEEAVDEFASSCELENENEELGSPQPESYTQGGTKLENYQLTVVRKKRQIHKPQRYGHVDLKAYAFNIYGFINNEPKDYKEACHRSNSKFWFRVMKEELESLDKN